MNQKLLTSIVVVVLMYIAALILWLVGFYLSSKGHYSHATYNLLLGHLVFVHVKFPKQKED